MKAGTVIAIGAVTVVVLGGGAFLLLRRKDSSPCQKLASGAALGYASTKGVALEPGMAQAAGSLACDVLGELGGLLAPVGEALGNLIQLPVDIVTGAGKAVQRVGMAAADLGRGVGNTVGDIGSGIGSGVAAGARTVGNIGGRAIDVTESVVGTGVSGVKTVVNKVNPFNWF